MPCCKMKTAGALRNQALAVEKSDRSLLGPGGALGADAGLLRVSVEYDGAFAHDEKPGVLMLWTSESRRWTTLPVIRAHQRFDDALVHVPRRVRRDGRLYVRALTIVPVDDGGFGFTEAGSASVPLTTVASGNGRTVLTLHNPVLARLNMPDQKGRIVINIASDGIEFMSPHPFDIITDRQRDVSAALEAAVERVSAIRTPSMPAIHPDIHRVVFDVYPTPLGVLAGFSFMTPHTPFSIPSDVIAFGLTNALIAFGWPRERFERVVAAWMPNGAPTGDLTFDRIIALNICSDAVTTAARAFRYATDRGFVAGRSRGVSSDTYSDVVQRMSGDCDDFTYLTMFIVRQLQSGAVHGAEPLQRVLRNYVVLGMLMLSIGGHQTGGPGGVRLGSGFTPSAHIAPVLISGPYLERALGFVPPAELTAGTAGTAELPTLALESTGRLAGCCAPSAVYGPDYERYTREFLNGQMHLLHSAPALGQFHALYINSEREQAHDESPNNFYMAPVALMPMSDQPLVVNGKTLRMMRCFSSDGRYGVTVQTLLRNEPFALRGVDAPPDEYWGYAARILEHCEPFVVLGARSAEYEKSFQQLMSRAIAALGRPETVHGTAAGIGTPLGLDALLLTDANLPALQRAAKNARGHVWTAKLLHDGVIGGTITFFN